MFIPEDDKRFIVFDSHDIYHNLTQFRAVNLQYNKTITHY